MNTFIKSCKRLCAVGFLNCAVVGTASAGLINTSFDDLGSTTVDLGTGLEWLDLTETRGLSVVDVNEDLSSDGGLFDLSDGWRYASLADFRDLASNWFGFDYTGGTQFLGGTDLDLVDLFVGTFGDTLDAFHDETGNQLDAAPGEYGTSFGILEGADESFNPLARVSDNDYVRRSDGSFISNNIDFLSDTSRANSVSQNASFGHFLVRDFSEESPVSVSEPSTLALSAIGLFMLFGSRRRASKT